MSDFKKELEDHYLKKSLSEQEVKTLLQDSSMSSSRRPKVWQLAFLAGAVSTAIVAFLFFSFFSPPLHKKIFKEVVKNHLKGMPSEVLSADYTVINEALDRLNFKVIPSTQLGENFALVGARYCSVQGEIAAQLKIKDKKRDRFLTLYQFDKSKVTGDSVAQAFTSKKKGVTVKIWYEGSIGFALAEGKKN